MKKLFCLGLALGLAVFSTAASAEMRSSGPPDQSRDFQRIALEASVQNAKNQLAESAGGPPDNMLIVSPQFWYSDHGELSTDSLAPVTLKSDGGHMAGGGIMFAYNRAVSDILRLTFLYQFTSSSYSGGAFMPADAHRDPNTRARSDYDITSHVVGVMGDLNFQEYGRLNLSLIQGFDGYDGADKFWTVVDGAPFYSRESVDDFSTRVTSLMAWYEIDAARSEFWTLTPYLGWRTLYGHISKQNQLGQGGVTKNGHEWIHLGSAGLKASFSDGGPLGFHLRAGLNHRFSQNDLPGYGNRAPAPGVVQFGYNVNFDQTVGTWGAGLTYAIPEACILTLGYDGFAGSGTDSHLLSFGAVIPF